MLRTEIVLFHNFVVCFKYFDISLQILPNVLHFFGVIKWFYGLNVLQPVFFLSLPLFFLFWRCLIWKFVYFVTRWRIKADKILFMVSGCVSSLWNIKPCLTITNFENIFSMPFHTQARIKNSFFLFLFFFTPSFFHFLSKKKINKNNKINQNWNKHFPKKIMKEVKFFLVSFLFLLTMLNPTFSGFCFHKFYEFWIVRKKKEGKEREKEQ